MNNTFTFVLCIIFIVLAFQLARTWLENKNKKQPVDEELQDTLAKIDVLEERIRVLERIITENRYDLKKEIDSL
ncbi:MAG: hypothetical protein KJO31_18850 [Gammaproteobacteria bacterium]|nr:hypothetical protein [Gammaproteobacteria bacterium]